MTSYSTTFKHSSSRHASTTLAAARPISWLQNGWNDLINAPMISVLLGAGFTLLCIAAYAASAALPVLSGTVISVLLIVSPFIAAAAYFVAREHEQRQSATLRASLAGVSSRAVSIGLFAIMCALIVGAWVRLSSIAFALFYGTLGENAEQLARTWTSGFGFPAMLVFLTAAALVLALTLFATGALALPMISDRNNDVITAVRSSLTTLRKHKGTMLVWILVVTVHVAVAIFSGLLLIVITQVMGMSDSSTR